jgi:hypothetical protein
VRPKSKRLTGPAPVDEKGRPLAPRDAWGHDHDWFATSTAGSTQNLILQSGNNVQYRRSEHAEFHVTARDEP